MLRDVEEGNEDETLRDHESREREILKRRDAVRCAVRLASHPTTMNTPSGISQFTRKAACTMGSARPVVNRTVLNNANPRIAAATCTYVRQMKVARDVVSRSATGVQASSDA